MATKLGSTTISKLYLGATEVTKAYLGSTEVYSTGGGPVVNNAFELTIDTTAANETFLLPMLGVTSIDVDWGDGTVDTGITTDSPTHVYATAGTYPISVTGTATRVAFAGSGSQLKIKTVTNIGALGWTSFLSAFEGCENLDSFVAGDCNTSNVTRLDRMFFAARQVTTFDFTNFDTSNVTTMRLMFPFIVFTGPTIDVSNFNTSKVTDIYRMFRSSSFLDVVGLENWDVTSINYAVDFLQGADNALTTAEYDAVLVAWAAQAVQSNVTIHFGDAQYTAGSAAETARNTLVSTYGWTITDGGAV